MFFINCIIYKGKLTLMIKTEIQLEYKLVYEARIMYGLFFYE